MSLVLNPVPAGLIRAIGGVVGRARSMVQYAVVGGLVLYGLKVGYEYYLDREYSREVVAAVNAVDNLELDEKQFEIPGTTRFQWHWVHKLRSKFGLCTDSRANRQMFAEWLRREWKEHGMRPSHISKYHMKVVIIALTPMDSDLELVKLSNCRERQRRIADCDLTAQ